MYMNSPLLSDSYFFVLGRADFRTRIALQVVLDYLTINAVSPLQAALVQTEDPLCNDVGYMVLENKEIVSIIQCSNVPTQRLQEVIPR